MKKVFSLLLVCLLLCASLPGFAAVDTKTLEALSIQELEALRTTVDDILLQRKKNDFLAEGVVEASRTNPAPIRATVICKEGSSLSNAEFALRVESVVSGKAALEIAKSFDRYNQSQLPKGKEWVLVQIYIEALTSADDKIDIYDFSFAFVDQAGVDCEWAYLSGNPAEVRPLFVGANQTAWLAAIVPQGEIPALTYRADFGENILWFSLVDRVPYKGDEITLPFDESLTDQTRLVQFILMELGFYKTSPPLGELDKTTVAAIKAFQKNNGIKSTGDIDEDTVKALLSGEAKGLLK